MQKKWIFYSSISVVVLLLSSGFKLKKKEFIPWFHTTGVEELNYRVLTEEESFFESTAIPFTGKTFAGFKQVLAFKESQGKYHLINDFGYMGKYQFGMGTLQTIGVKDSVKFMNSPVLQEKAFLALLSVNKHILKKEIEKYDGRIIQGIPITESGMLAAAHLGGAGSVKKFLRSNGNNAFTDGYGTNIKTYLKKFAHYDTSIIVANANAKVSDF